MTGKALHQQLLEGFEVKSRKDGTVHTVKHGGRTVAEVCVGTKKVRLNVRAQVKAPKNLPLAGKSKTWAGGGCILTEENVSAARALLASITKTTPEKPKRTSTRRIAAAA
jgi:hypothetical protein